MYMEKELVKVIHGEKPTLSEMSVKTYANCIVKVMEFMKSTNLDDLYKDPHKVIKILLLIHKLECIYLALGILLKTIVFRL